jgi:hypothetical protein
MTTCVAVADGGPIDSKFVRLSMPGNFTEHHYSGNKIEIHTEPIGQRWDWWFVLNDAPPRYSAEGFADSREEAIEAALATARRVIDSQD